ncbi:MAG: von Willebrand factor type A domain-containing protein, partial [Ruminiclostridium sp.]|nr:von Willebrand factor type A domain-containing protein [Ruminiclostridium sp.]
PAAAIDNSGGSYSQEKSLAAEPAADFTNMIDFRDNEEYTHYDIDGFKKASDTPLSTFSADVDTASFANVRRMARDNRVIREDAVRIEEFLNYFDYNYAQPKKGTFSLTYEYTDCPWNSNAKLLMMGIQTKEPETEPSSNLVFLIDVSGSMYSKDKLPLVVDSLKKLSREMTKDDRISVVTYSGKEKVIVSGAYGNMKNCIADLCDTLVAYGCTNGERGINMAYEIAAENFIKDGNNRVIMATDGDLNVGISDKDDLSAFIAGKRESGVYLSILGFGTGNLKDDRMEALAKEGNGNFSYIDCAEEATKVLVEERVKNLVTVADDTKIQVEFNPTLVNSYRLIGYDGRKLNNEDFANDAKDAADMGAGQSITVMYEIIPASGAANTLTYQTATGNTTDLCKVRIRFKKPGETKSKQSVFTLKKSEYLKYSETGIRFRFASCVAKAAMSLRSDDRYGDVSLDNARARFEKLNEKELEKIGYSGEFADLLEMLKKQ